jgi:hypothetical protein
MNMYQFRETKSGVRNILKRKCRHKDSLKAASEATQKLYSSGLFGFACNFGDRGGHQSFIIVLDLGGRFC